MLKLLRLSVPSNNRPNRLSLDWVRVSAAQLKSTDRHLLTSVDGNEFVKNEFLVSLDSERL